MVEARPHLLTYSIGDGVMVLVVEVLVDVLGLLQAVADVSLWSAMFLATATTRVSPDSYERMDGES